MTKPRILIVEDEAIVAQDLSAQLTGMGYEAAALTSTGEDAVVLAGQLRPDLALMDIHIQGAINGIAAAQAIREQFDIPVVFISAYLEESVLNGAKAAQPFGYVSKPFHSNELRMVIDLALTKHKADAQLRQSHEEQAAILRTAMDGFWTVDALGRFLEVNEAYCRMTGYSREELLRMSIADVEGDEQPDEVAAQIERVKQSGGARFERRHRRKDGRLIDVELSVNYLPASGGRLFCFVRDISERRHAEETLRRNEHLHRSILNNIPDPVWMKDLAGRHVEVNQAWCQVTGLPREKAIGKTNLELFPSEAGAQFEEQDRSVIESGKMQRWEESLADARGNIRLFETLKAPATEPTGEIFGTIGITRDISERKQAEGALRVSEQEFRTLAEAMPQIVWATRPDGWNIYFNQQWVEYTGLTLEESHGHGWNKPFHPDDQQRAWEAWQEATQHNKFYSLECRLRRADGVYRWWLIRGAPLHNASGEILKWFGTCTDIEDIKKAEASLQASLEEKTALLKEVHHRVKNNLQVISSLLRLQATQTQNTETEAALHDMNGRVRSMALVHEHLYQSTNLASVDLASYLKRLCDQLLCALAQSGAVAFQLDLASVRLGIDQAIPCGLLVNELVSNSLKHAFPAGRAGVVRVDLQALPDSPTLRLRVADNGVGLPAGFDLNNLKSLGLELVSMLAQQLHGKLEIGPGPGAMFEVVFTPRPGKAID